MFHHTIILSPLKWNVSALIAMVLLTPPLNAAIPEDHWTNIDTTGFEMENGNMDDFAGAMSITIYKTNFLELEELCEFKYISTFFCHFFLLE
jgi:hypothetical protein